MTVDRPDIVEPELLEQAARQHHAFHVGLGSAGELPSVRHATQRFLAGLAQRRVFSAGEYAREIVGQGADVLRDRHVVVVQHHQQVRLERTGVVERLEGLSGGHRAITDHRHDAPRRALLLRGDRHAERCADRGARVTDAEGVVGALGAGGERCQAVFLLDRPQAIAAAGQHLVRVSLMADIPDQTVIRCGVDIVQRHGELDRAESSGEMTAARGDGLDQVVAQFGADRAEFAGRERAQIMRGVDARQQGPAGRGGVHGSILQKSRRSAVAMHQLERPTTKSAIRASSAPERPSEAIAARARACCAVAAARAPSSPIRLV